MLSMIQLARAKRAHQRFALSIRTGEITKGKRYGQGVSDHSESRGLPAGSFELTFSLRRETREVQERSDRDVR